MEYWVPRILRQTLFVAVGGMGKLLDHDHSKSMDEKEVVVKKPLNYDYGYKRKWIDCLELDAGDFHSEGRIEFQDHYDGNRCREDVEM